MTKIVAIVGAIGAGKTTAVNYFKKNGFKKLKLTQAIYDEADKRGLDRQNRKVLQDLGDEMRQTGGVAILAEKIIEIIRTNNMDSLGTYVLDSIRNHNELIKFREEFGDDLLVVSIDAPVTVRFERAIDRKGQYKEQEMTFEEFTQIDTRDQGIGNADSEQNVRKCMNMADKKIVNDEGLTKYVNRLESFL